MTAPKPRCPIVGCGVEVARGKFMCREHWFMAPARTRGDVNRRWRAVVASREQRIRREAITLYRRAREQALAAVQAQLP